MSRRRRVDFAKRSSAGERAPQSDRRALPAGRIYTPEELRAANPYAWAGRFHNYVVNVLREETRKPNVFRLQACERVITRLSQNELGPGAPTVTTAFRDQVRAGLAMTAACRVAGSRRVSWIPAAASLQTWTYPSGTTEALAEDLEADVLTADDATELASILSPYYTASLCMSFPDKDYIQVAVGVAQDSWDGWSPEGSYGSQENDEQAYLAQCEEGDLEDAQYTTDEGSYQCSNSQWLQIMMRSSRQQSLFHMAALSSGAQGYWCTQSTFQRGRFIAQMDVAAMIMAGLGAGAFQLLPTQLVIAAYMISAGGASSYLVFKRMAYLTRNC